MLAYLLFSMIVGGGVVSVLSALFNWTIRRDSKQDALIHTINNW